MELLANYQVTSKIGQGTQAMVFSCLRRSDYLLCALRIDTSQSCTCFCPSNCTCASSKHENELLTSLKTSPHPNLISILDMSYDCHSGQRFIVMPLLHCDLLHWVTHKNILENTDNNEEEDIYSSHNKRNEKKNQLKREEVLQIGFQLASALEYLHHQGFAHGDVKLENVLVNYERSSLCVCLTDFGSAVKVKTDLYTGEEVKMTRLKNCSPRGSPHYVDPQQHLFLLKTLRNQQIEEDDKNHEEEEREQGNKQKKDMKKKRNILKKREMKNLKKNNNNNQKKKKKNREMKKRSEEEEKEEEEEVAEYLATKSDIYGLGVLLFALLTGYFPFADFNGDVYYFEYSNAANITENGKKRNGGKRKRREREREDFGGEEEVKVLVEGDEKMKKFFQRMLAIKGERRPTAKELVRRKEEGGREGSFWSHIWRRGKERDEVALYEVFEEKKKSNKLK